jgi:hypothetical protein
MHQKIKPRKTEKDGAMAFDIPGVIPNSDEETLFKAVGFVVVQWGCAEHVLDMLVSIVFPIVKDMIKDKKQPQFLTHKTKFVRNHLNCHHVLQQLSGEITELLDRFEKTGKKRNDLVHGAITALSPENGSFKFAKLDIVTGDVPTLRPVLLDDAEWISFRKELLSLGADGILLVKKALEILKEQP